MNLEELKPHADERGELVEIFNFPTDGQVFYIKINPLATRGNHYHKRKTEIFCVIDGAAVLKTRNRDTGIKAQVEMKADDPITVSVRPNYTHSITALEQGATVIVWSNTRHSGKFPDTYREEV